MLLEIHFRRQTNKEANKQKHTTVLSGVVSFLATEKTLGYLALSLPFARSQVADNNDNSMVINCLWCCYYIPMLIFGDDDRDSDVDDIGDVIEMTSTTMMMIMTMTNVIMIIEVINDNGGGDCEEMIPLKTGYTTFHIVFAPIQ